MPNTLAELLTPRELEYARLISEGYSNREIARQARVSSKYIANRLSLLYLKLGLGRVARGSSYEPRTCIALRYDRELGRNGGVE